MENKTDIVITKDQFERYRKVQLGGKFNMITEAYQTARDASLTTAQYFAVVRKFSELKAKFEPDSD